MLTATFNESLLCTMHWAKALCSFSHLLNLHSSPVRQTLILLFSAAETEVYHSEVVCLRHMATKWSRSVRFQSPAFNHPTDSQVLSIAVPIYR